MVYGIYQAGTLEGVTQDESLAQRIIAELGTFWSYEPMVEATGTYHGVAVMKWYNGDVTFSEAWEIVPERVQTVPCGKVAFAATEQRARELLCS